MKGARLQKTDKNLETSVCRGYTGYWCYVKTGYTTKSKELDISLEMKKCGETSMSTLTVGDFTDASVGLDVFTWYDLEFQMVGNHLSCRLLKYGDRGSDESLASIETSDSDFDEVRALRVLFIALCSATFPFPLFVPLAFSFFFFPLGLHGHRCLGHELVLG